MSATDAMRARKVHLADSESKTSRPLCGATGKRGPLSIFPGLVTCEACANKFMKKWRADRAAKRGEVPR